MEIVKKTRFIADYYETEDGSYVIVKEGHKWGVYRRIYSDNDLRRSLLDGYDEEFKYGTLKDAKQDVTYDWNRRFNK